MPTSKSEELSGLKNQLQLLQGQMNELRAQEIELKRQVELLTPEGKACLPLRWVVRWDVDMPTLECPTNSCRQHGCCMGRHCGFSLDEAIESIASSFDEKKAYYTDPVKLLEASGYTPDRYDFSELALPGVADTASAAHSVAPAEDLISNQQDSRRVVVLTPDDVAILARDDDFRAIGQADGLPFIVFEVALSGSADDLSHPEHKDLLVTRDVEEVKGFIGDKIFFIWSSDALDRSLNQRLEEVGSATISATPVFIREMAKEVGERNVGDIVDLGFRGGPSLDLVVTGPAPEPAYCAAFITDIISFLIAIQLTMAEFDMVEVGQE